MSNVTKKPLCGNKDGRGNADVQPLFSPHDVALFETGCGAPILMAKATQMLMDLVAREDELGRFADSFSSHSESVASTRAAFRLCRAALDFLEADFLSEEDSNLAWTRRALINLEQQVPKAPAERLADTYWLAEECLDAAGLKFQDLVDYFVHGDGKVEGEVEGEA